MDLSVVIVNYNTKEITLDCLRSVYRHTKGVKFEVILVDSASTDNSLRAFEKFGHLHHHFHLVPLSENRGFGYANNQGAKLAKGKYLLFLNSDTLIHDDVLSRSLSEFSNSKLGALTCVLKSKNGQIQQNGGYFPNLWNLIGWQFFLDDVWPFQLLFKSIHPKPIKTKKVLEYDWVTGACLMLPRLLFKKIGGFDPKIFMYTEELELCYRLKKTGKIVLYHPSLSITHLGGASGGSRLALLSEMKNLVYFWQKHLPEWQIPLVKIIFWCGSLLRIVLFGIIKNDVQRRKIYSEALRLHL